MDHEQKRLFRKNPKSLNKSSNSAVSHKLVVKNERPSSLSFEESSQQSTLSFPGLSFIDSDSIDNGQAKLWLTSGSSKTKLSSEEKVIESQPRRLNPVFKRELDSPTKSLQLELPLPADDDKHKETGVLGQRRSSSLCILALKTAAVAKSQKAHLRSSQASSLSSMISLPGVPPVQGVNDVQQVQLHRQKSSRQKQEKSSNNQSIINTSNSRLQSEEDLILSLHRKQEFKSMNSAKLKQEEDILSNIRKREMIDKLNKGDATDKRNKELVKKKLQENQQNYGIASGLLKTRNLLVAPITSMFDHENHQDLIPPPASDHPNERRIVRWLKSATIQSAPELVVQAETRFSESPFVQECFQWHNQLRRRHLAPDLVLDAPVST